MPSDATAPRETPCLTSCPAYVRDALQVIGAKWAAPVLLVLSVVPGPLRYGEVRRRVGGIAPKELAKQLRALEAAGLVRREIFACMPPRVEYSLTELGRTTWPVMTALADWGARLGGARAACAEESWQL